MAEVKMRYNPETEEVELVVDDEVALSSGKEEFVSWVDYYEEVHPRALPEPEPEPEKDWETEFNNMRDRAAELEAELAAAKVAKEEPETPPAPEVDSAE